MPRSTSSQKRLKAARSMDRRSKSCMVSNRCTISTGSACSTSSYSANESSSPLLAARSTICSPLPPSVLLSEMAKSLLKDFWSV